MRLVEDGARAIRAGFGSWGPEMQTGSGTRFRRMLALAVACVCLLVGGCSLRPRIPYTAADAAVAEPPGYGRIRVFLDGDVPNPQEFGPTVASGQATTYLALSGGGGNGAYGAGVLNGWSRTGTRPKFTAVSGVSTGALIAPFAFLGSDYDDTLRRVYTDGNASSLIEAPDVLKVVFGSGLFGNSRILDLVSQYVGPDMIAAIAREHKAGRRLYVLTTNLDSKRAVVWNIGAIAASGQPDALDLIRKVLAASASVPLAFSPVLIDAEANGHAFREMHADGNVTTAVFTLPLRYLTLQKKTRLSGGTIYILMNTSIDPKFAVVENATLPILSASINTLITQKTLEDLGSIYSYAKTNHVDFNLTAIDPAVDASGAESFDTAYMRNLYAIGVKTGLEPGFWRKAPPSVGAPSEPAQTPTIAAR